MEDKNDTFEEIKLIIALCIIAIVLMELGFYGVSLLAKI